MSGPLTLCERATKDATSDDPSIVAVYVPCAMKKAVIDRYRNGPALATAGVWVSMGKGLMEHYSTWRTAASSKGYH